MLLPKWLAPGLCLWFLHCVIFFLIAGLSLNTICVTYLLFPMHCCRSRSSLVRLSPVRVSLVHLSLVRVSLVRLLLIRRWLDVPVYWCVRSTQLCVDCVAAYNVHSAGDDTVMVFCCSCCCVYSFKCHYSIDGVLHIDFYKSVLRMRFYYDLFHFSLMLNLILTKSSDDNYYISIII